MVKKYKKSAKIKKLLPNAFGKNGKSLSLQRGFAPLNPHFLRFFEPGRMRGLPSLLRDFW